VFRVEVIKANGPRYPKVRRINQAYLVPYEQLSAKLQQINKMGGRVTSITQASM